jgi:hypothetical protein
MPGINKVESLSKTRTQVNAIDEMCQQIADYSKQAQAEIQSLVEKVCCLEHIITKIRTEMQVFSDDKN